MNAKEAKAKAQAAREAAERERQEIQAKRIEEENALVVRCLHDLSNAIMLDIDAAAAQGFDSVRHTTNALKEMRGELQNRVVESVVEGLQADGYKVMHQRDSINHRFTVSWT